MKKGFNTEITLAFAFPLEILIVLASSIRSDASSLSICRPCEEYGVLSFENPVRVFWVRDTLLFARFGGSYAWYRSSLLGILYVLRPSKDSSFGVDVPFGSIDGEFGEGVASVASNMRSSPAI